MSPAMFAHSSSPQNALLGSATLAPLRWCLLIFGHFGIVGAIWGVGKQNKIVSVWSICRRICGHATSVSEPNATTRLNLTAEKKHAQCSSYAVTCWVQLLTYTSSFLSSNFASANGVLWRCVALLLLSHSSTTSVKFDSALVVKSTLAVSALYALIAWWWSPHISGSLCLGAIEIENPTQDTPMWHHEMSSVAWVYRIYHDGICSVSQAQWPWRNVFGTKRR